MRRFAGFLLLWLALAGSGAWYFREPLGNWWQTQQPQSIRLPSKPIYKPDAETYAVLIKDLERWRRDLSQHYAAAAHDAERRAVEQDARILLERVLPAMMHCWLGTPWDFHGTAELPGNGRIACGYFVSTILRDAGFQVDRYRLAQQPSENILRTFLPKEDCTLSIGKSYERFTKELQTAAPGIYLIGLDTHVAFLLLTGEDFRCVHAAGTRPWCVVDQNPEEAEVVRRSNWRMLGNLTANAAVLRQWLQGDAIAVRSL